MHTVVPDEKMEEMFEISRLLQELWPGVGGVIEWENNTWQMRNEQTAVVLGATPIAVQRFLTENKRPPDEGVESKGNLQKFGRIEGVIEED